jgi:hypothetical protein
MPSTLLEGIRPGLSSPRGPGYNRGHGPLQRLLKTVLNATARRGPSALKFHNARLFVAGQGLSNIGTFSQVVALSLLVL